jgi:hypothetical protein
MSHEQFVRHRVRRKILIARGKTMKQITLAAATGFERHGQAMRKAEFLSRMEGLMPLAEFVR